MSEAHAMTRAPQRLRSVSLFDNFQLREQFLRTTESQGNKCLICWRWRMTSFSGVSQKLRAPTLTWVMSIPLRQRLISALNCTRKIPSRGPISASRSLAAGPLPQPTFSRLSAAILGRRQLHNAPPLHLAQAAHEVVAEEYRILE